MAWLCKYIKSLLQANENLSVKSAFLSASGSAYVFMFSDNSNPLLSVQPPQTQLFRSIFWWCWCLKRGRPHSGFLKCCRAVFRSVYAHYFSFGWLRIWRTAFRGKGAAPRGSHFLCLVWSSLIAYPVLIRSPLQAPRPAGGCAECLRNHIFVPVTLVFPERERSEEQMRNVLIGIQLCGRICQSISISMQISEIKVDFTGTRPLWCRGHRSNVVN